MLRRFAPYGGFRSKQFQIGTRRSYKVLAIESSCDDSCVALIDRYDPNEQPKILAHMKTTLDSREAGGVVPMNAHHHHQQNLAPLVEKICSNHGLSISNPPDLICVTRGPGMVGSLTMGLELAKGLALAWGKPMIGVHHMLGHLLIPRISNNFSSPNYPFLSLLVSGGHTIVVLSKSLTEHEILLETLDIACGDSLDKCARAIGMRGNMLGKEMEEFINSGPIESLDDFIVPQPLGNKRDRIDLIAYSFTPFISVVNNYLKQHHNSDIDSVSESKRRAMAYKIQEALFTHLVSKIKLLFRLHPEKIVGVKDFVCSGGVGANLRLREKLSEGLMEYNEFQFHFPSPNLCTDNAIMIATAGIEIYETLKIKTSLNTMPLRKWPINDLLNVPDWEKI